MLLSKIDLVSSILCKEFFLFLYILILCSRYQLFDLDRGIFSKEGRGIIYD